MNGSEDRMGSLLLLGLAASAVLILGRALGFW